MHLYAQVCVCTHLIRRLPRSCSCVWWSSRASTCMRMWVRVRCARARAPYANMHWLGHALIFSLFPIFFHTTAEIHQRASHTIRLSSVVSRSDSAHSWRYDRGSFFLLFWENFCLRWFFFAFLRKFLLKMFFFVVCIHYFFLFWFLFFLFFMSCLFFFALIFLNTVHFYIYIYNIIFFWILRFR